MQLTWAPPVPLGTEELPGDGMLIGAFIHPSARILPLGCRVVAQQCLPVRVGAHPIGVSDGDGDSPWESSLAMVAVTASSNRFSGGGNCVALPAGGASLGPDVARRNVTIRHRPGSAMATSPLSIRTPRDCRISLAEKRIPAWRRRHRSCSLDSPAG